MHTKYKQNIQDFRVTGINYKKTDAATRGLFAINNEQYDVLLAKAVDYGIKELFILSTCNRTEIYGFSDNVNRLADLLCFASAGDTDIFAGISYSKKGYEAIAHLFQVGAGLDSQILGDYEILGQIKNAVKHAKSGGFVGSFTERLVNSVIQSSKAIKTHTALSGGTVSVSFAAIQYIREYFEGPALTPKMTCPATNHIITHPSTGATVATCVERKKIVLLGTGKIGRATCRNIIDYLDSHNITLINRTKETAINLAKELNLSSAPIEDLEIELQNADIVLVSTNATEPVIFKKHLEGKGDKLVIDLSVPCNVETEAQKLSGITFVDVDMLSKIKDKTLQNRKSEIPKAVAIIDAHIAEFKEWYQMRRHVPILKEVKNKLEGIYIDPIFLNGDALGRAEYEANEAKIRKVINSLAAKIRHNNALGCNYIQAINEFIG